MDTNIGYNINIKKIILKKLLENIGNPLISTKSLYKEEMYGNKIENKLFEIFNKQEKFNIFLKKFNAKVSKINDTFLISNHLIETLKEFSFNKYIFVSPRKSGTHLVSKLFNTRFYNLPFNGKLDICSKEMGYYSLGNTFHTSFNKFFYKLDRENFDGGKLLPINNYLGIVTCRHPADIFYSHINYSFKSNNTSFSNLKFESEKEKLDFIINSNAYEDLFKSLYDFTSWSRLSNFVTLPFENIINLNNNYNDEENNLFLKTLSKIDLIIYEKDLKNIFNDSPTFYKGKIGSGINFIKENCKKIFKNEYYKKYCDFYGYSYENAEKPRNLTKINSKEINLRDTRPINKTITLNPNYMNHTIFYYNNYLYANPKTNNLDFKRLQDNGDFYLKSYSYDEVKFKILSNLN